MIFNPRAGCHNLPRHAQQPAHLPAGCRYLRLSSNMLRRRLIQRSRWGSPAYSAHAGLPFNARLWFDRLLATSSPAYAPVLTKRRGFLAQPAPPARVLPVLLQQIGFAQITDRADGYRNASMQRMETVLDSACRQLI